VEIVIIGLALSSSWGNGHATTWRALARGLAAEGHRVTFLERDVPWYAAHRDLPAPRFCDLILYDDLAGLMRHKGLIAAADAVVVGSYVPDGAAVIDAVAPLARRLAFYDIDTPVTLDLLEQGEEAFLARRQVPAFDLYFSFTGGPILRHLETRFGAREARALYCAVDPGAHAAPGDATPRWDLGYLGTFAADRQPGLEALLLDPARRMPGARFVVAGPQYPEGIDWPANVDRIDHLPPDDHAAFYAAQRFTLNVTRAAMRAWGWAPSVRLFEAAAAGVPILSDRWPGIGDVLPEGQAVTVVDGTEDVIAALRMPEAQRLRQVRAARDQVLAAHSGAARARDMAAALGRLPARMETAR
jgi:spore maturation protein CgeB